MILFLSVFKTIALTIPFISVIFYPFWNAKIYSILNFLVLVSFFLFFIYIYVKKTINLISGYKYLIFFFLIYLISFSFSPVRDIISAEYVNFISGLIIFTLVLNSNELNFRYYYFLFYIVLFVFLFDNFFNINISSMGNTNLFAFIFLIIISMLLEKRNYYNAIPFFVAILFTKSYAAILSIFFAALIYMFKNSKLEEFKNNILVYTVLVLLIIFLILNIPSDSIYNRLSWWAAAIRIFHDRFFIGWGYSSFTHLFSAYSSAKLNTIYTHNFLLSVLAEGGIFAFLFFIIFLYRILRQIEGINKYTIIVLIFHSFFDIGLDTICGWWIFMFYLGISSRKAMYIVFLKDFNTKFFYGVIMLLFFLLLSFVKFSYSLIYIEETIAKSLYLVSLSKHDEAINVIDKAINKYPSSIDIAKTRAFIYSRSLDNNKSLLTEYLSSLEYLLILNPYQKDIYQALANYYKEIDKKAFYELNERKKLYIKY